MGGKQPNDLVGEQKPSASIIDNPQSLGDQLSLYALPDKSIVDATIRLLLCAPCALYSKFLFKGIWIPGKLLRE